MADIHAAYLQADRHAKTLGRLCFFRVISLVGTQHGADKIAGSRPFATIGVPLRFAFGSGDPKSDRGGA
jgi:hypothetical protein